MQIVDESKSLLPTALVTAIFSLVWFYLMIIIGKTIIAQSELLSLATLALFIVVDFIGSVVLCKFIIEKKILREKKLFVALLKFWAVCMVVFIVFIVPALIVAQNQISNCEAEYLVANESAARSPPSPYLCYMWVVDIVSILAIASILGPHNLILLFLAVYITRTKKLPHYSFCWSSIKLS
jgi:hypothetical protein